MRKFDKHIEDCVEGVSKGIDSSAYNELFTELLISSQKIVNSAEKIKSAIIEKKCHSRIGELLILCAKIEEINDELVQIMHEYIQ